MRKHLLKSIVIVLFGLMALIPLICSIFKGAVDCDPAYYICIAERISEGYRLYFDITTGYTPIWLYVMAAYKTMFCIPSGLYWPYLCLLYIVEILTAVCLYKIMRNLDVKQIVAYNCSCLFLITIHWLDGNSMMLEIPFMFFGLLSCLLILEWKYKEDWRLFFIGLLSCFSFLSKQYGAVFFVLDIYVIIFIAKKSWRSICYYIVGYMLPVVLCLLIWEKDFINCVFNGYGTISAKEAGYDVSFIAKLKNMFLALKFYLSMICPFVIVSLFFLPAAYKQGRLNNFIFSYLGIIGFLFQFYFSSSDHYFLPLIPFGIIIISQTFSIKNDKYLMILKYLVLFITVMITLFKTYYFKVYKQYIKSNERCIQEQMTYKILTMIDTNGKMFIPHGQLYYIYFTANVLPPNLKDIGYSFGPLGLNVKKCAKQVKDADYVLHLTQELLYEYYQGNDYEYFYNDSIKHYVDQFPCDTIDAVNGKNGTVVIHYMK